MKAIVEYEVNEYREMCDKRNRLRTVIFNYEKLNHAAIEAESADRKAKGMPISWMFNKLNRYVGYAHYSFEGEFSARLIEALGRTPDDEETIMLIDGGFSHFGATCNIHGNHFRGRVNTD